MMMASMIMPLARLSGSRRGRTGRDSDAASDVDHDAY
jgi:hypothetical protein